MWRFIKESQQNGYGPPEVPITGQFTMKDLEDAQEGIDRAAVALERDILQIGIRAEIVISGRGAARLATRDYA